MEGGTRSVSRSPTQFTLWENIHVLYRFRESWCGQTVCHSRGVYNVISSSLRTVTRSEVTLQFDREVPLSCVFSCPYFFLTFSEEWESCVITKQVGRIRGQRKKEREVATMCTKVSSDLCRSPVPDLK